LLVLAEIIFSTLKMEAICSSKTSVATQQTTWCQIPEDDTLYETLVEKYEEKINLTDLYVGVRIIEMDHKEIGLENIGRDKLVQGETKRQHPWSWKHGPG
jgi:hypothetical protein